MCLWICLYNNIFYLYIEQCRSAIYTSTGNHLCHVQIFYLVVFVVTNLFWRIWYFVIWKLVSVLYVLSHFAEFVCMHQSAMYTHLEILTVIQSGKHSVINSIWLPCSSSLVFHEEIVYMYVQCIGKLRKD